MVRPEIESRDPADDQCRDLSSGKELWSGCDSSTVGVAHIREALRAG